MKHFWNHLISVTYKIVIMFPIKGDLIGNQLIMSNNHKKQYCNNGLRYDTHAFSLLLSVCM